MPYSWEHLAECARTVHPHDEGMGSLRDSDGHRIADQDHYQVRFYDGDGYHVCALVSGTSARAMYANSTNPDALEFVRV